jgi:hypothetical protein
MYIWKVEKIMIDLHTQLINSVVSDSVGETPEGPFFKSAWTEN